MNLLRARLYLLFTSLRVFFSLPFNPDAALSAISSKNCSQISVFLVSFSDHHTTHLPDDYSEYDLECSEVNTGLILNLARGSVRVLR